MNLDNDLHDDDPQEREISLGTATIVGIFLALALVCAAFFGFGYSLGRHSNPTPPASASETHTETETKTDSPFSKFKSQPSEADNTQTDTPAPAAKAPEEKTPGRVVVSQDAPKAPSTTHPVAFPVPAQPTTAPASSAVATGAPGTAQSIVQVSATSRQGDAEALITALRQKGYTATIQQQPQDKLFHVQIGPFATKKEADAMRQRLDTDGYKAIVK